MLPAEGLTTAKAKPTAIALSNELPPSFKMLAPISEAR
jgi:hypothetical protein